MKNWSYEEATERVYMASYVADRLGTDASLNEIMILNDHYIEITRLHWWIQISGGEN